MVILEPENFFFKSASTNDVWQYFGKFIQAVSNCHSIAKEVKEITLSASQKFRKIN